MPFGFFTRYERGAFAVPMTVAGVLYCLDWVFFNANRITKGKWEQRAGAMAAILVNFTAGLCALIVSLDLRWGRPFWFSSKGRPGQVSANLATHEQLSWAVPSGSNGCCSIDHESLGWVILLEDSLCDFYCTFGATVCLLVTWTAGNPFKIVLLLEFLERSPNKLRAVIRD